MRLSKAVTWLAGLAVLAVVTGAFAAPQSHKNDNDPDLIEIRHYPLKMAKIEQLAAATDEVNKILAADPALKKEVNGEDMSKDESITKKAARIDTQYPQFAAVLHRHGLTSREYIVVTLAFMNDVMIVGMKKQGSVQSYPPNTITTENAAFVEQNYDKLVELGKRMSPPDEGDQN